MSPTPELKRGFAPSSVIVKQLAELPNQNGEGSTMPLYEHIFLTRQDVSAQQVKTLTTTYETIIAEQGGKIDKSEYWGLKSLAYKIKKNRKAHYSLLNIDASHNAVAEMERQMSLSPDILRFMTIKVDEHETEPSVMMRKSDRDDRRSHRGGRGPGGNRPDRRPPQDSNNAENSSSSETQGTEGGDL